MTWFPIALCCAIFASLSDASSKLLMRENDEWITGALMLAISCVVLAPVSPFLHFEPVSGALVTQIAIQLPLEILGYYLFLSAIRMSPLSITAPLLAFSPVITILTGWIVVGESIDASGAAGVILVAMGAYLLHFEQVNVNLIAPIRAIYADPGAQAYARHGGGLGVDVRAWKKGRAHVRPAPIRVCASVHFDDMFFRNGFMAIP